MLKYCLSTLQKTGDSAESCCIGARYNLDYQPRHCTPERGIALKEQTRLGLNPPVQASWQLKRCESPLEWHDEHVLACFCLKPHHPHIIALGRKHMAKQLHTGDTAMYIYACPNNGLPSSKDTRRKCVCVCRKRTYIPFQPHRADPGAARTSPGSSQKWCRNDTRKNMITRKNFL